ncbi:MAG: NrfD/PsrC family molybdoenzyme membrane anchor subunit, partial [Actinomycetota bacterium]
GYTGVLLGDTAIPIWDATRRSLPPLFVASAAASAAALLEHMDITERERKIVRRFGLLGQAVEVGAMYRVERDLEGTDRVGRPLQEGLSGSLWRAARRAAIGGLILGARPRGSKTRRMAAGGLGSMASLALRFALFHAGKVSSRDPRATFEQQRARMDGPREVGGT